MKRFVLVLVLAAALRISGVLPFHGSDVAELVPLETLTVDWNGRTVILNGGLCSGYGEDWDASLEDLRRGAEGIAFLGTVEQIVLTKNAAHLLPDVIRSEALRPAAVVCVAAGNLPEPEDAAKYLSSHDAGVTIQKVQAAMLRGEGIALPVLKQTEGGLRLIGSEDR